MVLGLLVFLNERIRRHFSPARARPVSRSLALLKSGLDAQVVPILSRTNFWGTWENVDCEDRVCFNPTLLGLPFHDPSKNVPFVVVARDPDNTTFHPTDAWGYFTGTRSISGSLVDLPSAANASRYRWAPSDRFSLQCRSTHTLQDAVHMDPEKFPRKIPEGQRSCFLTTGPEDPRIFYSHLGEPLLLYNSVGAANSEHCRHFYLVDIRAVYDPLREILARGTNSPPPIRFRHSIPILYEGQKGLQKNWMPFSDVSGNIYFHTDLVPQTIYKLSPPTAHKYPSFKSRFADLVTLEPVVKSTTYQNCILNALDLPNYELDNSLGNQPLVIHQATPFLEAVLCKYDEVRNGSCDPELPANRIYMGIFHVLHRGGDKRIYERRIITLESTPPFKYLSVSKPLMYSVVLL